MPDQITKLLDQIDRLDQESTPGPWHYMAGVDTQSGWFDGYVYSERDGDNLTGEVSDHDAEFIALARTALPAMSKALRGVAELHARHTAEIGNLDFCPICVKSEGALYPCSTVRTITDALGGSDGTR